MMKYRASPRSLKTNKGPIYLPIGMASILQTAWDILQQNPSRDRDQGLLLPTSQQDVTAIEAQQQQQQSLMYEYEEDTEMDQLSAIPEITEEDVVERAYMMAKHNTFRPDVYEQDFYRGLDARVPQSEDMQHSEIMWRIDQDHPIVIVLMDVSGVQPYHVINDLFGVQFIFYDHDVRAAVGHLLDLCQKYRLPVLATPVEEEEVEDDETGKQDGEPTPEAPTSVQVIVNDGPEVV